MRFRKRASSATTAGRFLFGDRPEPVEAALATEERSALLQPESFAVTSAEPREEALMGADPTQRLLTCLGRFQRQVAKAESGVGQDAWCDECMNQIITGVEIAVSQRWENVREALTDTARILQSYEEPGRADECVPFLQDSYEILCLMVGDIIVDNTRSGVMRKWRERYEQALGELQRASLLLIDDEAEEDPRVYAVEEKPRQTDEHFSEAFDVDEDTEAEDIIFEPAQADLGEEEALQFEDKAFQQLCETAATDAAAFENDLHPPVSESTALEDPMEEEEAPELEDDFEWSSPSEASTEPLITYEEVFGAAEEDSTESQDESGDFVPAEAPADILEPQEFHVEEYTPLGEHVDQEVEEFLNTPAEAPVEMPLGESGELEEFEPVLPEELPAEPAPESQPALEVAPVVQADTVPAQEDDQLQALFRTVQNAVTRGDVAQAKVLALQLAASMARLEVERAEHTLDKARARLAENERATEIARAAVRQAEEDLAAVETRIAESQQEFQAKRQQIGELRERASAIEAGIEDIDAQILALQERRAIELEHRDRVEQQIEETLSEESRVQTDMEELSEAERLAQQYLDEQRQRVEHLVEEHLEQEDVIVRANAALDERVGSAGEIQRTLHTEDRPGGAGQAELQL